MMTITEVSRLTGVSARALRYYDEIGLFHPRGKSEAGYRLYDEHDLAELRRILFFRELDVPLDTIKAIVSDPALDRDRILHAQRAMLTAEKERLERLIASIDDALKGADRMDFTVFGREESAALFGALLAHMPEPMKETAIKQFGSVEEWKESYLHAVSSEKVQKQYAKVVEWYGAKEPDGAGRPLSEEIGRSYKKRIDRVLDKLAERRAAAVDSLEVREAVGEYGFVLKQLLQLKDEKDMMLAQARAYLEEPLRGITDAQYGDGFADFLHRALVSFYDR